MTKTLFLFMTLFISVINAQEIAKVSKVNGVEVYILAEPIREYEVVMGGKNSIKWSSFATGGLVNDGISSKISQFVKTLQEKAQKEDVTFDAVIYTNGKSVNAIKFTDEKTEENDRLAEVQKIDGIPVFVMNEPLKKYSIEDEKGGGVKWKSFASGGLVNNSIEEDIEKYASKFKKSFKKGEIDGLIYSRGKKCNGIKFVE